MSREARVDDISYGDGTTQYVATPKAHYYVISISGTYTINRADFTPAIPADVTVIPWLEVRTTDVSQTSSGAVAHFAGFGVQPGATFHGTALTGTTYCAVYQNVQVGDGLNLLSLGDGPVVWMVRVFLPK